MALRLGQMARGWRERGQRQQQQKNYLSFDERIRLKEVESKLDLEGWKSKTDYSTSVAKETWRGRQEYLRIKEAARIEREKNNKEQQSNEAYFEVWRKYNQKQRDVYRKTMGTNKGMSIHPEFARAALNASDKQKSYFHSMYPYIFDDKKGEYVPADKSWSFRSNAKDIIGMSQEVLKQDKEAVKLFRKVNLHKSREGVVDFTQDELIKVEQLGVKMDEDSSGKILFNTKGSLLKKRADRFEAINEASKGSPTGVNFAYYRELNRKANSNEVTHTARLRKEPLRQAATETGGGGEDEKGIPIVSKQREGFAEPKARQKQVTPLAFIRPMRADGKRKEKEEFGTEAKEMQLNLIAKIKYYAKEGNITIGTHHIAAILSAAYAESSFGVTDSNIFQHKNNWIEAAKAEGRYAEASWEDNLWTLLFITHGGALKNSDFLDAKTAEQASDVLTLQIERPQRVKTGTDILTTEYRSDIAEQFQKHLLEFEAAPGAAIETPRRKRKSLLSGTDAFVKQQDKAELEKYWEKHWDGLQKRKLQIDQAAFFKDIPAEAHSMSDKNFKKAYPIKYGELEAFVDNAPGGFRGIKSGDVAKGKRTTILNKAVQIIKSFNRTRAKLTDSEIALGQKKLEQTSRKDRGVDLLPTFHNTDINGFRVPEVSNRKALTEQIKSYLISVNNSLPKNNQLSAEQLAPTQEQINLWELGSIDAAITPIMNSRDPDSVKFANILRKNERFIGHVLGLINNSISVQPPGRFRTWTVEPENYKGLIALTADANVNRIQKALETITPRVIDRIKGMGGVVTDVKRLDLPNGTIVKSLTTELLNDSNGELVVTNNPAVLKKHIVATPKIRTVPGADGNPRNIRLSVISNSRLVDLLSPETTFELGNHPNQKLSLQQQKFLDGFKTSIGKLQNRIIKGVLKANRDSSSPRGKSDGFLSVMESIKTMKNDKYVDTIVDDLLNKEGFVDIVTHIANISIMDEAVVNPDKMIQGRKVRLKILNSAFYPITDKEMRGTPEWKDIIMADGFAGRASSDIAILQDSSIMAGAMRWRGKENLGEEFKRLMVQLFPEKGFDPTDWKKDGTGESVNLVAELDRILGMKSVTGSDREAARELRRILTKTGFTRLTDIGTTVDIFFGKIHALSTVMKDYLGATASKFTDILSSNLNNSLSTFNDTRENVILGQGTTGGVTANAVRDTMEKAQKTIDDSFKRKMERANTLDVEDPSAAARTRKMAMLSAHRGYRAIMLTYSFAGMVQGGSGGRAISNEDFENIYRALWAGGTHLQTGNLAAAKDTVNDMVLKQRIMKDALRYGVTYTNKLMDMVVPALLAKSRYNFKNRYTTKTAEEVATANVPMMDKSTKNTIKAMFVRGAETEENFNRNRQKRYLLTFFKRGGESISINKEFIAGAGGPTPINKAVQEVANDMHGKSLSELIRVVYKDNGTPRNTDELRDRGLSDEHRAVVEIYLHNILNMEDIAESALSRSRN